MSNPTFGGIPKRTLTFVRGLGKNNNIAFQGHDAGLHLALRARLMSALLVSLALAWVGGCSKSEPDHPATKAERATTCIAYQMRYWRGVADAPDQRAEPDWERYACAELYSRRECPAAWSGARHSVDLARSGARHSVDLARACSSAYCEVLGGGPSLCRRGPETLTSNDLVRALVELDTAILTHELGDRGLAAQLAARLRILRTAAVAVPPE